MMQEIIPKIKDKQVILFGEIHGTKEIPELLSNFFKDISTNESFNLCLEIPDEFQGQINSYMNSGDYDILKNILFFSIKYCTDGRNSLEYINLIKTIYKINYEHNYNIKIFCVLPSLAKSQEEVEKGIANKILETINNNKTFAIMGNIHASKKKINFPKQKIVPAGFLIYEKLKDRMSSIILTAKSGEFFNNGVKKLIPYTNGHFERNFDYAIRLEKATPCSFL
jgi:hypothetical protein